MFVEVVERADLYQALAGLMARRRYLEPRQWWVSLENSVLKEVMAECGLLGRASSRDLNCWEPVMDAEVRSLMRVPSLYHDLAVLATDAGILTV